MSATNSIGEQHGKEFKALENPLDTLTSENHWSLLKQAFSVSASAESRSLLLLKAEVPWLKIEVALEKFRPSLMTIFACYSQ